LPESDDYERALQIALQSEYSHLPTPTSASASAGIRFSCGVDINSKRQQNFYILNVAATKTESDAQRRAASLRSKGYEAGYLWIPDYASLSGAKMYSVYIGPFYQMYDCELATEEYRKDHPDAYGLLVSQNTKRVEIRGIGRVKVIRR
jgi:hypothetical protein